MPHSAIEVLPCRLISKTHGFIAFHNQRKYLVVFLFRPCIDFKKSSLLLCIGSRGSVQNNTIMGPQKIKYKHPKRALSFSPLSGFIIFFLLTRSKQSLPPFISNFFLYKLSFSDWYFPSLREAFFFSPAPFSRMNL